MSSKISASMGWVLPVRPDKLGSQLENFTKALPVLQVLRLCHRFGRGPKVHITKLPPELVLLIESFCLQPGKLRKHKRQPCSGSDWEQKFMCFESRCTPTFHTRSKGHLLEEVADTFEYCENCAPFEESFEDCLLLCKNSKKDPCEACQGGDCWWRCEKSCRALEQEAVEEAAMEDYHWQDSHDEACAVWQVKTSVSEVEKMNITLRKHFGLEATFSETRTSKPDEDDWPKEKNFRWHYNDHKETTICHLTIPRPKASKCEWSASDTEMESYDGSFNIAGTQTLAIDTKGHLSRAKIKLRFQKAMTHLGLEACPHPSQTYSDLCPVLEPPPPIVTDSKIVEENDKREAQAKPKLEWPKLVLMLTSVAATP